VADGFNVMPLYFHGGSEAFVQLVVPILQERGLFRTIVTERRCAIIWVLDDPTDALL
jgi:hypothetical protein